MLCGLVVLFSYGCWLTFRSWNSYRSLKARDGGFEGRLFAAHPLLGACPVPDSVGKQLLPFGAEVPIRHDPRGFRIPADGPVRENPRILALGCSFTYGWACRAEEAYPYRLEALTGLEVANAGGNGFGLTQIVLLGRLWIPRLKPETVTVQFSTWLPARAASALLPAGETGRIASPYYYEQGGKLRIHPPRFRAQGLDLPHSAYRSTPRGLLDFLSYLGAVGLRLHLCDDLNLARSSLGEALGVYPAPVVDRDRIVRAAYSELSDLCRAQGARLVVVLLGAGTRPRELAFLRDLENVTLVDADRALLQKLPDRSRESYHRAYYHWGGDPPRVVDMHLNAQGHGVVAEAIAEALAQSRGRRPSR